MLLLCAFPCKQKTDFPQHKENKKITCKIWRKSLALTRGPPKASTYSFFCAITHHRAQRNQSAFAAAQQAVNMLPGKWFMNKKPILRRVCTTPSAVVHCAIKRERVRGEKKTRRSTAKVNKLWYINPSTASSAIHRIAAEQRSAAQRA